MTTADPAAEGEGVVGWEGREDRLGNATEQGMAKGTTSSI